MALTKCHEILALLLYFCLIKKCANEYLDVNIDQGTVRGYNSDEAEVFSFYGIPYATAPMEGNKFRGPLPPPIWTTIFNATEKNTICLQQELNSDPYYKFKRKLDCLHINVFKPKGNAVGLPVFVYIHGGALLNGYGMELSPMALTKKGMITVTFNFRVGVLGFMCLSTDRIPGNAGLKDQVAALKWVQRNIKNFGGDPKKVTLAGCSSGATNIELLVVSPTSQGLFSQAILESGSLFHIDLTTTNHIQMAIDHAQSLGADCNSIEELQQFYTTLEDDRFNAYVGKIFLPCIEADFNNGEEIFLVEAPIDTLVRGNFSKVPLIVAIAPEEGMSMLGLFKESKKDMSNNFSQYLPSNLKFKHAYEREDILERIKEFYFPDRKITEMGYINYFTDIYFTYPLYLFARLNSRGKSSNIFFYVFKFRGTIALPDVDLTIGQGHIPETLYVVDYDIRSIYNNMTDKDREMREKLQQYYANFVKYGNPNLNNSSHVEWKPFTEDEFYYLDIDEVDTLRKRPMKEHFTFWNEIYDKQFNLTKSKPIMHSSKTILIILSPVFVVNLIAIVWFSLKRCKATVAFENLPTENKLDNEL